jgi:hypothetical protein
LKTFPSGKSRPAWLSAFTRLVKSLRCAAIAACAIKSNAQRYLFPIILPKDSSAGRRNELLAFLYIARGSAGEVRSMLCVMESMATLSDLKSVISELKALAESISRQLRGWAQHLQDTPIRGQRHVTAKSRQTDQSRRERDEFLRELEQFRRSS